MKVFVSWSGDMSRQVAIAFRNWLPSVIQAVKPFVSAEDIDKGERWSDSLAAELTDTKYGIVCVTPYNLNAPWINFEAGALAKQITRAFVAPVLFRVDASAVRGPLQQFQFTNANQDEEIFNLLCSLNNQIAPDEQLTRELLRKEFDVWLPDLRSALVKIADTPDTETETGYSWLFTGADLLRRQAMINCKEIWVITPQLLRRTLHPRIKNTLLTNLERKIVYTFITPSSDEVAIAKEELAQLSESHPNQIILREMPKDKFQQLAVTDYIILNPNYDDSYPLHVYLELPVGSPRFWIEPDIDAGLNFVQRFHKLATEGFTG